MLEKHRKIARIYDFFIQDDYLQLARDPNRYPMPAVVPPLLQKHEIDQSKLSVLDLGCGPGNLKEYTNFADYTGVDISPQMLKAASQAGYQQLIQASVESYITASAPRAYDGAFCLSVAYFLSPEQLAKLVEGLNSLATSFWLLTLDAIPIKHALAFENINGVPLYNHLGYPIPEATERFMVEGWYTPEGERVPMEIVFRKF